MENNPNLMTSARTLEEFLAECIASMDRVNTLLRGGEAMDMSAYMEAHYSLTDCLAASIKRAALLRDMTRAALEIIGEGA